MDANSDFRDLLKCFDDARVRYLVVGAHAVAYHAEPRYTKDIDVWVEPTKGNADRVWQALTRFGAPLGKVTRADLANPELVYQIGIEPNRIDVLMGVEGVTFRAAWRKRIRTTYAGVPMYVLSRYDLLRAKRASGRPQDLLDIALLTGGKARRARRRKA